MPQINCMQFKEGESIVAHQPHSLGAIALAPRGLLTNRDPQLGYTAPVVDMHERNVADQPLPLAHDDRKSLVVAILDDSVVPLLLMFEHERHAHRTGVGRQLEVAE